MIMKRAMLHLMAASLILTSASVFAADDNSSKQRLDSRVNEVNHMGRNNNNTLGIALDRIATETGIPRAQVESAHKRHPEVGPGGLMVGGVIADDTKKSFEDLLNERDHGKSWDTIARENKVSYD